jgi:hypothetical protein
MPRAASARANCVVVLPASSITTEPGSTSAAAAAPIRARSATAIRSREESSGCSPAWTTEAPP